MRCSLLKMAVALLGGMAMTASAQADPSTHLSVELLPETAWIQPGQHATLALHFKIEKGWHLYWQNPGDSGLPPSVKWNLAPGLAAGPIQWPRPQRLAIPSMVDFAYQKGVTLLIPLDVAADVKPGTSLALTADLKWLVCKDVCIPGKAELNLILPVQAKDPQPGPKARLFAKARQALPVDLPLNWTASASPGQNQYVLAVNGPKNVHQALFFPLHQDQIENAAPQPLKASPQGIQLSLKPSDQAAHAPDFLEGVLVLDDKVGYNLKVPFK